MEKAEKREIGNVRPMPWKSLRIDALCNPADFRKRNIEFSIPISKLTKFEVRRIFTEHPDTGYMLSYLLQARYLTIKR